MYMKRTQIYLTEKQHQALAEHHESDGTNISEMIRRLIDQWITAKKNQKSSAE